MRLLRLLRLLKQPLLHSHYLGVGCYEGVSAKDSQPIQIFIECERRSAIVAEGSEVPDGT